MHIHLLLQHVSPKLAKVVQVDRWMSAALSLCRHMKYNRIGDTLLSLKRQILDVSSVI